MKATSQPFSDIWTLASYFTKEDELIHSRGVIAMLVYLPKRMKAPQLFSAATMVREPIVLKEITANCNDNQDAFENKILQIKESPIPLGNSIEYTITNWAPFWMIHSYVYLGQRNLSNTIKANVLLWLPLPGRLASPDLNRLVFPSSCTLVDIDI